MTTTSPRLVTWEHGTDLVIEVPLARGVETVWNALTDSESAGSWFAPFRLGAETEPTETEPADAESAGADADEPGTEPADADEPSPRPITFALGDVDLDGTVLSCEECDHVLLELGDFGVLGIRLVPAGETNEETVLVFTQTSADVASARTASADFGSMWDTHLRLFARSLGLDIAEATEPELDAVYSSLDLETLDAVDPREGEA